MTTENLLLGGLGLIGLLLALWTPRWLAVAAFFAIVFGTGIGMGLDLPALERTDELAVALLALAGLQQAIKHGLRWLPGSGFLAVVLVLQLVAGVVADVDRATLASGLVLQAKCVIGGWGVLQIRWRATDAVLAGRALLATSLLVIAGTLANVVVGPTWSVSVAGYTETRFGLPTIVGLLPHSLALSFTGVVLLALLQVLRKTPARVPGTPVLMLLLLAVVVLSGRRTGVLTGLVILLVLAVGGRLRLPRSRWAWAAVPVVGGLTALAWPQLSAVVDRTRTEYLDGIDTNPRWIMLRTASDIAREQWPLGTGAGTFGSAPSVTPYSQVYVDQGLEYIWGLSPEYPYFLLDSAWPGILGEGGWFAPAAMLIGLALLFRALVKIADPALRLTGLVGLTAGLVASLTSPVYTAAPYFLAAYLLPALVVGVARSSTPTPVPAIGAGPDPAPEPGPEFSIVIATVDDDGDLARCLKSLCALAPEPSFEVILADQNRPGYLHEVLMEFAGQLDLRYLHIPVRGASRARNLGAARARGAWVLFLDDDARVAPDALARSHARIVSDPRLAVLSGRTTDPEGRSTVLRWEKAPGVLTRRRTEGRLIESVTFLRLADFREAGGYDENFGPGSLYPAAEGLDLVYRLLDPASGRTGWYDPEISVEHADAAPPWDDRAEARGFEYSRGVGAVARKHGRGPLLRVVLRTILRASVGSLAPGVEPGLRRYRRARVRGVLAGYREYRRAPHPGTRTSSEATKITT